MTMLCISEKEIKERWREVHTFLHNWLPNMSTESKEKELIKTLQEALPALKSGNPYLLSTPEWKELQEADITCFATVLIERIFRMVDERTEFQSFEQFLKDLLISRKDGTAQQLEEYIACYKNRISYLEEEVKELKEDLDEQRNTTE